MEEIKCPLKPCITCSATPKLVSSTPCPGCPYGRTSERSSSLPARATLISVIQPSDCLGA